MLCQRTHSLRLLGRGGLAIDAAANGMHHCVLAPHTCKSCMQLSGVDTTRVMIGLFKPLDIVKP